MKTSFVALCAIFGVGLAQAGTFNINSLNSLPTQGDSYVEAGVVNNTVNLTPVKATIFGSDEFFDHQKAEDSAKIVRGETITREYEEGVSYGSAPMPTTISAPSWYSSAVKLGQKGDATSLANFRRSIELVRFTNEKRAQENIEQNTNLQDLLITNRMMAIAQIFADQAAIIIGHPTRSDKLDNSLVTAENLAWSGDIKDVLGGYAADGWYEERICNTDPNGERCQRVKDRNLNKEHPTGHYENIVRDRYTITGTGVVTNSDYKWYNTHGQEYASKPGEYGLGKENDDKTYTADEYEKLIDEYARIKHYYRDASGEYHRYIASDNTVTVEKNAIDNDMVSIYSGIGYYENSSNNVFNINDNNKFDEAIAGLVDFDHAYKQETIDLNKKIAKEKNLEASNNTININGDNVSGYLVVGGDGEYGNAINNNVNINGGNFTMIDLDDINIAGGISMIGKLQGNAVNISGNGNFGNASSETKAIIAGAYRYDDEDIHIPIPDDENGEADKDNTITISGGNFINTSIYGVYGSKRKAENTIVAISGGKFNSDTIIVINENAKEGNSGRMVLNGGDLSGATLYGTYSGMEKNAQNVLEINGLNYKAQNVVNFNEILFKLPSTTANQSTALQLIGGGDTDLLTTNVSVTLKDATSLTKDSVVHLINTNGKLTEPANIEDISEKATEVNIADLLSVSGYVVLSDAQNLDLKFKGDKDTTSGDTGDNTGGDNTPSAGGDNTGGDNTGTGDTPSTGDTGGDNIGGGDTGGDNIGTGDTGGDNTGTGDTSSTGDTGGDNTGDNTGGDNTTGDNTDGDNTGTGDTGDNTGGDNTPSTGGDNTGGDNTETGDTGGDNTGVDNTGVDNTGGDNTGVDNTTGGDNTGGDNADASGDNTTGEDNTNTGTTPSAPTNNDTYNKEKKQILTANVNSKQLLETRLAGVAQVVEAGDLLADNIGGLNPNGNEEVFAYVLNSSNSKEITTGSHIESKGANLNAGLGTTTELASGKVNTGVFFEYGKGSFDSYLDNGLKGSGDTEYTGGGVFARYDDNSGLYVEGSGRIGKLTTESDKGKYDEFEIKSTYYGLHFGLGNVFALSDSNNLDTYAKYFYSHTDGDDLVLSGVNVRFDSVSSKRIKLGFRDNVLFNENNSIYFGGAYVYEADGKAKGSLSLPTFGSVDMASPTLKGSSGIAELGYRYRNEALEFNIGAKGYFGKEKGYSGNIGVLFKF